MASEYYKKKFQDIKPDAPLELTKKERWNNWWNYHWLHVLIAVGVTIFLCVLVHEWVFKAKPDYKIAYIGEFYLGVDTEELAEQIAELGTDLNGDGKVIVQLRSYATSESNPNYEPDMVGLIGDIGVGGSSIYILEDSAWFIDRYKVASAENCYAWVDCPVLSHIDLGGDYDIALRTDHAETEATILWNAMTAGAE